MVPTIAPTPTLIPTPVPTVAVPKLPLPRINDNPPHVFVGKVTIGGQPAPDGTEVTAWVFRYSDPVAVSVVEEGSYTLLIPQYGGDFNGTVLAFKVNGNFVTYAVWRIGGGDPLDLDQ
jgi:hypothetical protein